MLAKIYFKEIHIFGLEKVPRNGSLIISCNHNSQFVDALLLMISIPRPINFIIAASSTTHPFLKYFLKMVHVIPTIRPMDARKRGKGIIVSFKNGIIKGQGTSFKTEFEAGFSIRITSQPNEFLVTEVIDDLTLKVNIESEKSSSQPTKSESKATSGAETKESYQNQVSEARRISQELASKDLDQVRKNNPTDLLSSPSEYDIYPKLNQEQVYAKAIEVLGGQHVLGIFPEGGSHDKTELLPLKAGACVFIWAAKEKEDVDTALQCVGINYFGAHRFRSKVAINIGQPKMFEIDKSRIKDREYKRQFIAEALEELKTGMEEVKVSAPTLRELLDLYITKEILMPEGTKLDAQKDFQLYKKFCSGYKKTKDLEEIKGLMESIHRFRKMLQANGLKVCDIRDYKKTFTSQFRYLVYQIIGLSLLVGLLDYAFPYFLFAAAVLHPSDC